MLGEFVPAFAVDHDLDRRQGRKPADVHDSRIARTGLGVQTHN